MIGPRTRNLMVFFCLMFFFSNAQQSGHSGLPIEIFFGPTPQAICSEGEFHFVYEVHLINYAPLQLKLVSLEISDTSSSVLAAYDEKSLMQIMVPVEKLSGGEFGSTDINTVTSIRPGSAVILFLDVLLTKRTEKPLKLNHEFTFSLTYPDGTTAKKVVRPSSLFIDTTPMIQLQPPLRGAGWIAFNSLGGPDHRRAFNAVDGNITIAERFAIDWMRLGPDGRLFRDKGNSNTDYYSYGEEVLAVADGKISDLKNDLPDNMGSSLRSARKVTLENIVGNYIIIDLGKERYALYAHLKAGSLKVKLGDQVQRGEVIALLGNSGNSDEPHLHFQIMNRNAPLAAEGMPYHLEKYTSTGLADPSSLDLGKPWIPTTLQKPVVFYDDFPKNNIIVSFQ